MSIVAEYAAELHKKTPINKTENKKFSFNYENIEHIEAIIFDIYGTLIDFAPVKLNEKEKQAYQLKIMRKTIDEFGFEEALKKIAPNTAPEMTIADLYSGILVMLVEIDENNGKKFSEPKIDNAWNLIISILIRNGYDINKYQIGTRSEFARCVAYYFHFFSFGRTQLFENCKDTLLYLKNKGINLGLLSNTQFYTTLELTLLFREYGICEDYSDLFNIDFCFFSFDYNMNKKSGILQQKLFDMLYDYKILPQNTLFVSANQNELDEMRNIGLKISLANAIL